MKSAEKQALLESVKKANIEGVEEILKAHSVDDEAAQSLKAVAKLLVAKRGKITPELLTQVLKAAGFDGIAKKEPTDEDKACAEKAAKAAYDEHMKKLGYQMHPPEEIAQKARPKPDEDEDEEEDEDVEKSREKIWKSLLAKVPEDGRAVVESVLKQNDELVTKQAALEAKNAELGNRLDAVIKASKRADFVAKAKGYSALGVEVEKFADVLMTVQEKAPEAYETISKLLDSANEQVEKGSMFAEVGSSGSGAGIPSMDKIQKAAEDYVAKSGQKLVGPAAVDAFMQTQEGRQMYKQYQQENSRLFNTGEAR